jgi:hypothetical protein
MVDVLEVGRKYKIDVDDSSEILLMQYSFRPASIDTTFKGSLSVAETGEALLKLPSNNERKSSLLLAGSFATNLSNERFLVIDRNSKRIKMIPVAHSVNGLKPRNEETQPATTVRKESKRAFKQALAHKTKRPAQSKKPGITSEGAVETTTAEL